MTKPVKILAATWLASFMVIGAAHAEAKNPECRHGIESVRAVRQTIWCVANRLGIPGGPPKAVRIASRESGLGVDEINDSSGTCGVFQQQPAYWPARYRANMQRRWLAAPARCLNDRTNIIVSLTMVNRGGWGPWT